MTRFWITPEQSVELALKALCESRGGEMFIAKIPSFKVVDLAQAMLPGCEMPEIGIREGEKLHEAMSTRDDLLRTCEYDRRFTIYPNLEWMAAGDILSGGNLVEPGFKYSPDKNG